MSPEVHVVLVRTIYSRNLGAVSRAMGNMGGQKLILIDPQCEVNLEARQGAAGAQKHLLERVIYPNWDEFHRNEAFGLKIAFCGKQKQITDHFTLGDRIEEFLQKANGNLEPIYLVFGPEDDGLKNLDLELVHHVQKLPTYGNFASLNLSHAVLLALYMIGSQLNQNPKTLTPQATEREKFFFPSAAIDSWLLALGFHTDSGPKNATSVLKRILLKNLSTPKELRVLEAVIQQTVRKLKSKQTMN